MKPDETYLDVKHDLSWRIHHLFVATAERELSRQLSLKSVLFFKSNICDVSFFTTDWVV